MDYYRLDYRCRRKMHEKNVLADWDNTVKFVTLCDFTLKSEE